MPRLPNISIEEKPNEYSGIDCAYFEAGKTPLYFWLTFSSILQGEFWTALGASYPPPNGTWKLTQVTDEYWQYLSPTVDFRLIYTSGKFVIDCRYIKDGNRYVVFLQRYSSWDFFAWENYHQVFANVYYYSGYCIASWIPTSGLASVGEIADSVGIERTAKTFFQGIAGSPTEGVYRFARRSDHSCIKIKVEKPQ
jgi:hypothetical protein